MVSLFIIRYTMAPTSSKLEFKLEVLYKSEED